MSRHQPPITPGVFWVSGVPRHALHTEPRALCWDNGSLSGDPALVAAAVERAAAQAGEHVGPVEGPYSTTHHLSYPISALINMSDLFIPSTLSLSGDVPERPPIPEGAIG
jgi:hypothetical protein